ncbi:4-carboxymuconolactone decarboxylase [Nocardioides alpinus]|uniref:4-carboxymuconolactone decarboxylase n=1 Tax=Nocardioides alpinus TaxID=748909 RepID=A0A1I0ZIZ1_9ACTN|nr:carboxymuconolactone decarboxylase family protein [Nocardioides alpinus]PKH40616.1 carboxymuconolactone decarboxylase family protein [Nocardioides alpinus]SFB24368.1 4-carboxymuconolactone decarboxylase [Nocardioides alpinus]
MRLPDLTPADMTAEQRALHDHIVGGPRGSGTQHFALTTHTGALTGPFGVMVHEPALGAPLQELGSAVRYATGLTDRVREIAILAVAAATGSAFEQHAHERVGRAVGLTDDELAAVAGGTFTTTDAVEASAYALCRRLLADRSRLTTEEYDDLAGVLGTTTITELVVLVGYYRTLAQLLDVYDVGVPDH